MAYRNDPIGTECDGVKPDGTFCYATDNLRRLDACANDDDGVPFYFDLCPECMRESR